jgi:FkbM family methyltransferase
MRLPNSRVVTQLNPAETSLQYRNIVSGRSLARHGVSVPPGATVLDVGANIGIAALFFHWEAPGVRVLAFEPAAPLYAALERNLDRHGVTGRAYRCALGAAPGEATLGFYPHTTAMSSVYADVESDAAITRVFLANSGLEEQDIDDMVVGRHEVHRQRCVVRTLSEVLATERVEEVDLLKVNVEKAECDVLAGLDATDWPRIRQLVVQVHDIEGRLAAVRDEFEGRGYRVTVDRDPLLTGTDIHDVYAVRR